MQEPKYKLGDTVYFLFSRTKEVWNPCPVCGDTKIITIQNINYDCPECRLGCEGKLRTKHKITTDHYLGPMKVAQRRVTETIRAKWGSALFDANGVTYMTEETGYGGGHVYKECDLVPECPPNRSHMTYEEFRRH
jgi:hypothetical protein